MQALTMERRAPRGTPTTLQEFAAIAEVIRNAAPTDLADDVLDLPIEKRDAALVTANQALETASLAFTRAALR
jgi:hypothetical protein